MALNFFDYEQLTRGTHEGDQQQPRAKSSYSNRQKSPEGKAGSHLRIHVPELRRLHSDNTLRAQAKRLNSPLSPRSPRSPLSPQDSRPATSGTGRADKTQEPLSSHPADKQKRPETAQSRRTDVSETKTKTSRRKSLTRSLRNISLHRPKSRAKEGQDHGDSSEPTRPKSSGIDVKSGKRIQSRSRLNDGDEGEPRVQRSRANTMKEKASNILQQLTNLAAPKSPRPPQQLAPQAPGQPLTHKQEQFLAESLAHVTVGEWLWKDHNRPSLMPRNNPFRRQIGPPARGSTGLPQRRWFRISPYDRKVMWSSKWDASSLDQLRTSRQVPVSLVFETTANALFLECLPTHLIPFKRSIVIVAPQRIVKLTAPDELRHRMWLTALRYIANSTVKMDEEKWASELRARFEALSASELSFPPDDMLGAGGLMDEFDGTKKGRNQIPSNFFEEKPLPPSPPRSTFQRSRSETESTPAITPPAVPRWKHGKQRSEGVSTVEDSDFRLPSRGSDDEPVPAINLPEPTSASSNVPTSKFAQGLRRVSSAEEEQGEGEEVKIERSSSIPRITGAGLEPEPEPEGEVSTSQRESRRLTSDDFEVDQMEMFVNRLGAL